MKHTKKYPKSFYQFAALRESWKKSSSPNKDTMIEMLTESMQEIVEIYNLEQDSIKEVV